MEDGYTAATCWNAQIVLHAEAQIRGLASHTNRNSRWGDNLPIQRDLPDGRERGRSRREVAEDVRGPTVLDDSRSGTLAAGPDRAPMHRCIQHVRGHVASSGTLRNSIVPRVYLAL